MRRSLTSVQIHHQPIVGAAGQAALEEEVEVADMTIGRDTLDQTDQDLEDEDVESRKRHDKQTYFIDGLMIAYMETLTVSVLTPLEEIMILAKRFCLVLDCKCNRFFTHQKWRAP